MSNALTLKGDLSDQIAQLTTFGGFLPEGKRAPFLGRLKSYSSLGASQRQSLAEYVINELKSCGQMQAAGAAWDKAIAEGQRSPSVAQTAAVVRDKLNKQTAALKAAVRFNKLHALIVALTQLQSVADVETLDELVLLDNKALESLVVQLGNDDYAVIAPFLGLPKRAK